MTNTTMTRRDFFTTAIKFFEESGQTEMQAFAEAELQKLDKANETRRNKPTKAAEANAPLAKAIVDTVLADGSTKTTAEIAEALRELFPAADGEKEISTQRTTPILRKLVEDGELIVEDVKVPKKGVQKAYTIAPTDEQ